MDDKFPECVRCGRTDTEKYGVGSCVQCGVEPLCIEECLPGGKRTVCTQCEEDGGRCGFNT